MKFTDRSLSALKAQEKRYIAWADNGRGLGVRVSPQGKKTFIYMYRFQGRNRMMSLGEYPAISLADANFAHAEALKALKKGDDPGTSKLEKKQIDRAALTIEQLVEEYLERWAKQRKRSWKEDKRILELDILPRWKRRKAKDIQRRDVIALVDEVVKRGAPIQANRTFGIIRKMFNFALSRDLIPYSPCAGISPPSQENQRDRVLTEKEIYAFWHGIDKANMQQPTKLALKLILVTAQRAGEVVSAEWCELDLKTGWWIIPAEKAKNKLPHRVPLSPLAVAVLRQIKPLSGDSQFLFPSPRQHRNGVEIKEKKHIAESALGHAFRKNLKILGLENAVPHDLRRTAASHMTGMGISRLTVSKILNHVERGVTAVYDRYAYDAEKQSALKAWGEKLTILIAERALEEAQSANVMRLAG